MTYEPQVDSDVFGMFQSLGRGRIVPWELLVKDVPPRQHHDLDYLVEQLDWDANVNPEFGAEQPRAFQPRSARSPRREPDGYRDGGSLRHSCSSAKELTVLPGRAVTIKDDAAYGLIVTQGYGTFGTRAISTPSMIRFGEMTEDELFVTAEAAQAGVRVENMTAASRWSSSSTSARNRRRGVPKTVSSAIDLQSAL